MGLETEIWALSLEFEIWVGIWALRLGFAEGDWKMDFWARIRPLRLEAGRGGVRLKKEMKEKFPLCESIGHRPLRGRCPKVTKALDGQQYPCPA